MNREGCPVCGYKEIDVLDEFDCTTFEICSSCGNESGCDYDLKSTKEQFLRLRTDWVYQGSQWFGVNGDKPLNWSSHQQMRKAGLEYPKIPTIMAFFHLGLIDDSFSKIWADQNLESKNDKFEYLCELSLHGAKYCTDKTRDHYPPKRVFNIYEEFSLRTHSLDISVESDVYQFIQWFTGILFLELPDKQLKEIMQTVDFILDHRGIEDASKYLLKNFEVLKEQTHIQNEKLWDEIK